jgi:MEMO1 family protein
MWRAMALLITLNAFSAPAGSINPEEKVRPPAVAGAFYPADPSELERTVDEFLSQASVPAVKDFVALVSPHAGYIYSGRVAAHSYALLKGRKVERVIVIAPSHYEAFDFAAVYDGEAYATPLGQIPVDRDFASRLVALNHHIKLSDRGHALSAGRSEHAVEVQLPFLQRTLRSSFKLVPIVMGDQSYDLCRALGVSLAKLIRGPETLIVASSDLSHYHPYDEAAKMDHKTLKAIEESDYLSMSRNFGNRVWEACGGGPIIAAMIAAERLGANQAKVLRYANSGDVTGDRSRVVGYGAVAFIKPANHATLTDETFSLGRQEKEQLLQIARRSVETAVKEGKLYECSAAGLDALMQERGAFVTLTKRGQLRGCVGNVAAMQPLCHTVRDVAVLAAVRDRRFSRVTPQELGELEYEVSVLSPLRHVMDIRQIRVGRHGLMIKKGDVEGLLLPQVAVEQHWDRNTFLEQTCRKAGLPPGAWRDEETDIFLFSALVFGEHRVEQSLIPDQIRIPKPIGWPIPPGQDSPSPSASLF